ncbi:hypothetical protein [Ammoniphilus sp. 3BR4]
MVFSCSIVFAFGKPVAYGEEGRSDHVPFAVAGIDAALCYIRAGRFSL